MKVSIYYIIIYENNIGIDSVPDLMHLKDLRHASLYINI